MEKYFSDDDIFYMQHALKLAEQAAEEDEVPVGAVIVSDGRPVGWGYNQREQGRDATLHAEMSAIRQACATLGGWRIPRATLYVTLEPCPMCAGALVNARIERLIYAAPDPKAGAAGTVMNIVDHPVLNHRMTVESGLLAEESAALLRAFFARKREKQKKNAARQEEKADNNTKEE
ncbi:MAG: tRNA adenosine(34) deaminase TadA [Bacillota bacterium]|nr:tRNA adenosine(34) deaminase TadA [Bacillota bacterium]